MNEQNNDLAGVELIAAQRPTVRTTDRGEAFDGDRWLGTCNVAGCPWRLETDAKVVLKEYGRHHRNRHEAAYRDQVDAQLAAGEGASA